MKGRFLGMALVMIFAIGGFVLSPLMASASSDTDMHPACPHCGMDRVKFAHSRMLIEYADGTSVGTCSLHCAALDLAMNIGKTPSRILVADYDTKKLLDAQKAFWVIGGSKMGVMTKRAKWAFATKAEAEKYIQQYGGTLATFDEAMKAAFNDMYEDTKMIREKRKKMKEMKKS